MVQWYRPEPLTRLCSFLPKAHLAPGVREGISLLKQHGIHLALISLTWEFAVAWFAQEWGIPSFVGTRLDDAGEITHFWPEDKARWLAQLAHRLQLDLSQVAAVGDSSGDLPCCVLQVTLSSWEKRFQKNFRLKLMIEKEIFTLSLNVSSPFNQWHRMQLADEAVASEQK